MRGAWLAGGATALGAGIALMLSVTTGLPGFSRQPVSAVRDFCSLVLEAAFVMLFGVLVLLRRSLLLTPPRRGSRLLPVAERTLAD